MKEKIILIGGGGHCKSVIDVVEQEGRFEIAGIIEKYVGESKVVLGYPLIGTDDALEKLRQEYSYACVSIGHLTSNKVRVKLFEKLKVLEFKMPVIISPFAYVSQHATIGNGTIVMHHAMLNATVEVGENCIINSKALLEHDVFVGDNCHISTGAILNGGVSVASNSFVGSGSIVKQGIEISGFIKASSFVK